MEPVGGLNPLSTPFPLPSSFFAFSGVPGRNTQVHPLSPWCVLGPLSSRSFSCLVCPWTLESYLGAPLSLSLSSFMHHRLAPSLSLSLSLSLIFHKMLSVVHAPLLYCWDLSSRALLVSTISLVVLRLLFDTVPQSLHCQTNCWTLYNCWTYQRNLKSLNTQFASVGFIFQCCPLCWHCRKRIGCWTSLFVHVVVLTSDLLLVR